MQERLTREVATAIDRLLRPRGVAVTLEARHFCMMMRGVEKQGAVTTTSEFVGAHAESATLRQEFLAAVQAPAGRT